VPVFLGSRPEAWPEEPRRRGKKRIMKDLSIGRQAQVIPVLSSTIAEKALALCFSGEKRWRSRKFEG
jgi:hypothetical protein